MAQLQLSPKITFDSEKAISLPLGVASPLWFAFTGAAAAGVAFWWMTRWTNPANLEALWSGGPAGAGGDAVAAPIEIAAEAVEAVQETVDEAVAELAAEPVVAEAPIPEAPVLEAAAVKALAPVIDDLTRIVGIGPKLSAALAERGVTSFAQMTAWTEAELAALDKAMDLKGRAVRDAWVAQAKTFLEQA